MHTLRLLTVFLTVPALASCSPGEDGGAADATAPAFDSARADVCDCSALDFAAEDISFDNAGTDLQSGSVQAAVSELAGRTPAPLADSISIQEAEATDVAAIVLTVAAGCGGSLGDFQALGGGCTTTNSNLTLVKAELRDDLFLCSWRKTAGQSATGTARVSCLSLLP